MSGENKPLEPLYLEKFTARKVGEAFGPVAGTPDSLGAWIEHYLALAVSGVGSGAVAQKITLHLRRFAAFFNEAYGRRCQLEVWS